MSAVYPANGSVCSNNKQSTAKGGRGGAGVIGVAAAGVCGGGGGGGSADCVWRLSNYLLYNLCLLPLVLHGNYVYIRTRIYC